MALEFLRPLPLDMFVRIFDEDERGPRSFANSLRGPPFGPVEDIQMELGEE